MTIVTTQTFSPGNGLDSFLAHMENGGAARRALVVEPTQSHQEVIPSLVYYFNALGFGVDVLLSPLQSESRMIEPYLQTIGALDVNFFYCLTTEAEDRLIERINKTYTVVYCNTVFDFFVNDDLFAFCSRIRTEKVLATAHNYSHYAARKHLCPGIREDCVFVLHPRVAQETGTRYLSPSMFFFDETSWAEQPRGADFLCIGQVASLRRDYNQLIDACILLGEKGVLDSVRISVVCPASDAEYHDFFKANVLRYSLDRAITVHENLPFSALFQLAARTSFQLFLLNKRSRRNLQYLKDKITGGLNISFGFGVVPVLEDIFAENWGISSLSLTYDGVEGLAAAMAAAAKDPAPGLACGQKILERNKPLLTGSLDTLASVL